MTSRVLISALLTGVFCAGFALGVDAVTEMVETWQVAVIAMISGFCGSLFAHFSLHRGGR